MTTLGSVKQKLAEKKEAVRANMFPRKKAVAPPVKEIKPKKGKTDAVKRTGKSGTKETAKKTPRVNADVSGRL